VELKEGVSYPVWSERGPGGADPKKYFKNKNLGLDWKRLDFS